MKTKIKTKLATVAPSIAFTTSREIDCSLPWDGDGPDPEESGFDPYTVTVSARAIVGGEMLEGCAHLGGSYFEPDEPTGDIHGYLLQMLEEAAQDLMGIAELPATIAKECRDSITLLKCEMQAAYDAQRAEFAKEKV